MHQFYWFRMAIFSLPPQEETSGYVAVEHRQDVVVHTTELFQVFSLSPAYPGCIWTGHTTSCVRSSVLKALEPAQSWCVLAALVGEERCAVGHWAALHPYTLQWCLRLFVAPHCILKEDFCKIARFWGLENWLIHGNYFRLVLQCKP